MIRRITLIGFCLVSLLAHAQSARGSYRIAGKAVNAITGAPLSGARLELAPTSGAQWVKAALSGKDGSFAFDKLGSGKFQLYAERSGFARQGFDEHPGGFLSAIVTGDGIDSEHLVFRMQPGASISGVIKDDYDEAVRNAQVMLFERTIRDGKLGTYPVEQQQTDDRGIYKFAPLMAGTYFVVVNARPWYAQNAMRRSIHGDVETVSNQALNVAYPLTYYSDTSDADRASPINLRTGEPFRADFNLRAVQAARINIPVKQEPGQPHFAVMLVQKLFDEDVPVQSLGEMSSGDMRVISGFAPGRYMLRLHGPERQQIERSQPIDLYGNTTLDLDSIRSDTSASITGLASAQGVTLRRAFIQFRNRETNDVRGDMIGEDGKFKIESIPAGRYEVSVGSNAALYLANMAVSNAKASGRMVEIPAGADVRMAVILSKGVGEITGTALRGGKGVSGTQVILVPDDPPNHQALFRRDQSDSDGTFSLKQVVPGRYTLLSIDNWTVEWNDPKVISNFLPKGYVIDVEPNGKYDVKVAVQRPGSGTMAE